jgi:hypothetical protein
MDSTTAGLKSGIPVSGGAKSGASSLPGGVLATGARMESKARIPCSQL